MKKWLAGLYLIFAAQVALADVPSVHGMVIFGNGRLVSHLPMFHSPHDYQAIFQIQLDCSAARRLAADEKQHPDELYTVAPEAFDLAEMAASPKPFKATLYRGHFERGGIPIFTGAGVTIEKVLHFRKFDTSQTPDPAKYLLVAMEKQFFAIHAITAPPDFDHIAPFHLDPATLLAQRVLKKGIVEVSLPISEGELGEAIYFEEAELAH